MSDDDREVDVESDAEKRAHHNALERKRRDHIKDSFSMLRDSVPSLEGEKASRAQILNKATDYIEFMRRKNNSHQTDIDDLKRQNQTLEQQIRILERATTGEMGKSNGIFLGQSRKGHEGSSDSESETTSEKQSKGHKSRNKRLKSGESSGTSTKIIKLSENAHKR